MITSTHRNGALSFVADMGFLLLVIVVGAAATVWFLTQPENSQRSIVEYVTNLSTGGFIVLLAQPGVFLTYKIANGSFGSMPKRRRIALAVALFAGLAIALPTAAGWYIQSILNSL